MSSSPTALAAPSFRDLSDNRDRSENRDPGDNRDSLLDRFVSSAPTRDDVGERLGDLADGIGDRLGIPGRDVPVLGAALGVAGVLLSFGLFATADPDPGPMRQLEVQHQQWVQQQAAQGPVATLAP